MRILYFRKNFAFRLIAWLLLLTMFITIGYLAMRDRYAETTLAPIYQGSDTKKEIALTVNVYWGEEYLPQMLKIMQANDIKATFFIGGQWAEKYPELLKEISYQGHEIGSHGYSHPHPDHLTKDGNLREIKKSESIITQITGKPINLFAPPYGERGKAVLAACEEANYQCILWSVDTIDWQRPAPEVITQRVTQKAHNGAIVLMHPTAPTVKALPEMIKELKQNGYKFVKVSEMIQSTAEEQNPTAEK
ncbi:polysaccharide deacetylase family protein [Peptococcaceae bacterium 1198_IL3148]